MEIIRYDGTRLMTEEDVDREFLGYVVLLDNKDYPNSNKGYLLASAEGERDAFRAILNLKRREFAGRGRIVSGSDVRGQTIGIYGYI